MTRRELGWEYREPGSGGPGYLQRITIEPEPAHDLRPLDIDTIRTSARDTLTLGAPLRDFEDMRLRERMLRGHLVLLVSDLTALVNDAPAGDLVTEVARVSLAVACRTLRSPPAHGLWGSYRSARLLARRVAALCSHYESLHTPH